LGYNCQSEYKMKPIVGIPSLSKTVHNIRFLQFNSRLLRNLLKHYYRENHVYAIPFGPLRLKCLRYHADVNLHMMLGLWETKSTAFLRRIVPLCFESTHSRVICDVGANIGYTSLWFSDLVASDGRVYAFEPTPRTAEMLRD